MNKSNRKLLLIPAALLVLTACGRQAEDLTATTDTPHGAILAMSAALQANDIETLIRQSLSTGEYAEAREEWNAARAGEIAPDDAQQLNEFLARIRDDALVDELMADLGPRLEAARENLPLMLIAAQTMGHASISNNDALTEAQKNSANELLGALGKWAAGRDLADPALAREALTVWVSGARELELEQASDLRDLEFEDMVGRAGLLLGATKSALQVYEFNLDDVLSSVRAETLRQQGDTALVRVRFELLGTSQEFDVALQRVDGRWMPAGLIQELRRDSRADSVDS